MVSEQYPKILLISNPPLSSENNMGRSLAGLLSQWPGERLAQLYLHSSLPDSELCDRYYRLSDTDALKGCFSRRRTGTVIDGAETERSVPSQQQYTSLRTPFTMYLRDLMWRFSRWDRQHLLRWVRDFGPDVILFAAGDCPFSYRVTTELAKALSVPVVVITYDDYFTARAMDTGFWDRKNKALVSAGMRRLTAHTSAILTICEQMSEEYRAMFRVPCHEIYTVSSELPEPEERTEQVLYAGNVGLGRWKQLVDIGEALHRINGGAVTVYSQDVSPEAERAFSRCPGIDFKGAMPYPEIQKQMVSSRLLIHTESFDPDLSDRVRLSVSTKIADSLASGVCLFAYGPKEVASVRYLRENDAACVVDCKADLEESLRCILESEEERARLAANAKALALKNHSGGSKEVLRRAVCQACEVEHGSPAKC